MSTRAVGDKAEDLAVNYLKRVGYKILDRNYQNRGGEIDIVARDRETLVFVEVKARYSHEFGSPIESITYFKMKALLKTALFYIQKINWGEKPYRIDLLGMDYLEGKIGPSFELVKNISL